MEGAETIVNFRSAVCVLAAMRILLANSKVNRFNTTERAYAMRCRLGNVDSSVKIIRETSVEQV